MNIKGTPAMSAKRVGHDLAILMRMCDVAALQEFRWPWYWAELRRRFVAATRRVEAAVIAPGWPTADPRWRSSPGLARGRARPVSAAQAVLWKGARFRRLRTWTRLIHGGEAGISEARWLRAVRLKDRRSKIACWFWSTHFVVGGDQAHDGPKRQAMLRENLAALDAFLAMCRRSGHPAVGEADLNIRDGWAMRELLRILGRHGAHIVGNDRGVEFLIVMDGRRARVRVLRDGEVPAKRLETDHEGRWADVELVAVRKAA